MFEALQGAEIGMSLTESWAMTPAASVSGFYIAHPDAAYFNVGKIGEDQIEDWARRTQQDAAQVRRSLAALL
ncbi:MAG: meth protein, partial [Burkholderiaceae bacterium]|nr:meth protein [Burkholderiaceae bacterium]